MSESQIFKKAEKEFGRTYNGRYHMPLADGEAGTKAGGNWVPWGLTRVTNLAGALADTRALAIWEHEVMLTGLAIRPDLYEELTILVSRGRNNGVDFTKLKLHPEVRNAMTGAPGNDDFSIAGRAKNAAGADIARQAGINRHDAWEYRAKHSELIGTPELHTYVLNVEQLLRDAGLVRVNGLQERVVRNLEVEAVGRFDEILMSERTGNYYIGDLKSKSSGFYSYLEVDIQLAVYAHSSLMLAPSGQGYEQGPLCHVDLTKAVILHAPSDGSPPALRKADLVAGWRNAKIAHEVMKIRSAAKNAQRAEESVWSE